MERNFYDDDEFEDFLKQKADLYSLYPSDRVWNGVYGSLHSRRKWYTATGVLLLITTMLFISIEIVSTGGHTNRANLLSDSLINTASFKHIPSTPLVTVAKSDEVSEAVLPHTQTRNRAKEITRPLLVSSIIHDHSLILNTREGIRLSSPSRVFIPLAAPSIALSKAAVTTVEEKKNKINWLRDMASVRLSPFKDERLQLQFYISPGASYRKLNTYKNDVNGAVNVPSSTGDPVNMDGIVDHQPAFGLEAGTSVLFKLSDHFILKGGVQLNFVRYNINAYKSSPERTAITLSSAPPSNTHETITTYSSLRNSGGRYPQELQNQYLQISLPIGAEIKILGDSRFQFNVAGTLQPTYLLYNNTYLLTSDYGNYTKQPDLVRKWNVNAAVETYISYSLGGLRWQAGPQFRYQLLSSYTDRYPIREYLTEYGIKIGVTKTLK